MMTVNTEYDGFIAKVLITSDSGNEIDLLSREFRIDIGDRMKSMCSLSTYLNFEPEGPNDPDYDTKRKEQMQLVKDLSTPILQISSENYREYCNSDDESLARNGVQFWLSNDKREMTMRFIPKNIIHRDNMVFSWTALLVIVGFDFKNVVKFDLCVMPRLITGDVYKKDPSEKDPVLDKEDSTSAYRPDYPFNSELDIDNLYVNNADGHETSAGDFTPVYVVKSSAFFPTDLADLEAGGYGCGVTEFDWTKFKSDVFNGAAQSGIPIAYKIYGEGDNFIEDIKEIDTLNPYQLSISAVSGCPASEVSGVNMYVIEQFIDVSAAAGQDPIKFAHNSVRLSLAV